jgi:hypothetical protein
MRQRRRPSRRTAAPRRAPNLTGADQSRRCSRRHRLTTEVHHTPNLNRHRRATAKRHIIRCGDHEPLQVRSPHSLTIGLRPLDRRNSGPDRRPRCSSSNDPTVSSTFIPEPVRLTRGRWAWSAPSTPDADSTAVARVTPTMCRPPDFAVRGQARDQSPESRRSDTPIHRRRTPPRSSPSKSPNEAIAPSAISSPSLPRGEALMPSIRPAPKRIKDSNPGAKRRKRPPPTRSEPAYAGPQQRILSTPP